MSGLDPDEVPASTFQDLISRHWEVENCLHWRKDRHFEEDKHVLRDDLGKVWTVLTNVAVSLTRLLWQGERTLREVGEKTLADPRPTAKRLGLKKDDNSLALQLNNFDKFLKAKYRISGTQGWYLNILWLSRRNDEWALDRFF